MAIWFFIGWKYGDNLISVIYLDDMLIFKGVNYLSIRQCVDTTLPFSESYIRVANANRNQTKDFKKESPVLNINS